MYTIGSLADLISGKNTPNKPKIEVKEVESKPFKSKKDKPDVQQKTPKKSKLEKSTTPKKSATPFDGKKKSPIKRKNNETGDGDAKKSKLDTTTEETPKKDSVNAKNAKKRMRDAKKKRFADPEKDSRTIFVGNVPISTQKKHLLKFFSKYGKIETVRFRGTIRASLNIPKKTAFITKQFHPSASTLHCYIVFEDTESCQKALEANGQVFRDNHIRVDLVTTSKDHDQKKAIFVGNIPFDAKEEDLWNAFKDCGEIESVRLVRDGLTGMGKGLGYVNFKSSDSVELALEMTDVKIKKRELRIKRANSGENKKRNEKGQKNRKVPRENKKKVAKKDTTLSTEDEEAENDNNENTEEDGTETESKPEKKKVVVKNFQGAKFSDKKKKKKINKGELKKKKISKILTKKVKTV